MFEFLQNYLACLIIPTILLVVIVFLIFKLLKMRR